MAAECRSVSDTPMHRRMFVELSPQDQYTFVEQLRERRLRVVREYEALQAERARVQQQQWTEALAKQLSMMDKDIATTEKAIERIDKRMIRIAALRAALYQGDTAAAEQLPEEEAA